MVLKYLSALFVAASVFIYISCSDADSPDDYVPVSPVVVDLAMVPYPKLSDYRFFEGALKNQAPSYGVLPYEPASSLFTDYAHKKRFVYLPKNTRGTFNGDDQVIELPVGAALIKTFYYDNILNFAAADGRRIIETRIMIRKADGWIFADYVWNSDQTEAYLDLAGSNTDVVFNENGEVKSTSYRIPSEVQCAVCHKSSQLVNGVPQVKHIPIGIKPQNLNTSYNYGAQTKNQLDKWIEQGFLEPMSLPSSLRTTVDYLDASKPLELRVRSYFDINCAHCHTQDRHCDYRPLRLAFSDTHNNRTNMGVCVDTEDMQGFPPALSKLITPGQINRSMLFHRLNTTDETYRMPLHGRTLLDEQALEMIAQWITSLQPCN
jgi:uncharacterized repeat protein (TIGR03806 family)